MAAPPAFDLLLLAVPVAAYVLSRRFSQDPDARWKAAARCALLFALGLAAARPFLTRRAVGTGEAYNYSLALADGIDQMRHGVMPPLVGQTAYAFNGRIHPLRNAPYLFYLAYALDGVTGRSLDAWELQNLSLAFSLIAVFFAAYAGLRWGTECPRPMAVLFAAAFGLSSGVLAAAYSGNLFMTVHAAPFVALALAACFRQCRHSFRLPDLVLAAALAGAWLAHPPAAYWLTVAVAAIRGLLFWRYPTWRAFRGLAAAGLLFLALSGFVFASVAGMSAAGGLFGSAVDFGAAVLPMLRGAFPGCLEPLAAAGAPPTAADFQLGYVGWALLLALLAVLVRRPAAIRRKPRLYCALIASVGTTFLLLALTLPIPGLTYWLWNHVPQSAQALTNIWPMQRVYLVALAVVLFAAAVVLPKLPLSGAALRRAAYAAAGLAACWIAWEARPFLGRGMLMRWTAGDTAKSHLSSNLDLTVTAYSYLETPPTFMNGVMDPEFEFRLLRNGVDAIDSPIEDALRTAPVVARGQFRIAGGQGSPPAVEAETITLQPHRRYLLEFSFHAAPMKGDLRLEGPSLSRLYPLPSAGGPLGFGMNPGNRRCVPVWTAQNRPETVTVRFTAADWGGHPPAPGVFADFALRRVDPSLLPIRLEGLLPLRFSVQAPEAGDFVETPRRWLPGYAAAVMGRRIAPLRSPWHSVMVPVPKGESEVELRYPGPPFVRAAFWVSACAWIGFVGWAGSRTFGLRPGLAVWLWLCRIGSWASRRRRPLRTAAGVAVVAGAVAAVWLFHEARLRAVGPIRVTFYLPFGRAGHVEPIVTTGKSGAGTTVYLRYLKGGRLKVGADIWGGVWETDPLPVNYFRQQNLVVDSSGLYPLDNPSVAALSAAERDRLRGEFRLELNGRPVLDLRRPAYDSTPGEVVVGRNAIQSSVTGARFTGEILNVRRLPTPRRLALAADQELALRVRLPAGHLGVTEPVLAMGQGGVDGFCAVTYLPKGRIRFAACSADGRVLEAAERIVDRGAEHRFGLALSRGANGGAPQVGWTLDGSPVLRPADPHPLQRPEEVVTGLLPNPPAGVDDRFTGSVLEPAGPPAGSNRAQSGTGPLRLVVSLPQGRNGAQEPLVTTGATGKGDFVYVVYMDATHIRLGYDHWGVSGGLSGPIAVDFGEPHELVVSLGSLYPDESDPAWGAVDREARRRLKSEITVTLDGRQVFRVKSEAWPSPASEITPGRNEIQGSNCGPAFSGLTYSAERLGLPSR